MPSPGPVPFMTGSQRRKGRRKKVTCQRGQWRTPVNGALCHWRTPVAPPVALCHWRTPVNGANMRFYFLIIPLFWEGWGANKIKGNRDVSPFFRGTVPSFLSAVGAGSEAQKKRKVRERFSLFRFSPTGQIKRPFSHFGSNNNADFAFFQLVSLIPPGSPPSAPFR